MGGVGVSFSGGGLMRSIGSLIVSLILGVNSIGLIVIPTSNFACCEMALNRERNRAAIMPIATTV